jgi:hypothetical protein
MAASWGGSPPRALGRGRCTLKPGHAGNKISRPLTEGGLPPQTGKTKLVHTRLLAGACVAGSAGCRCCSGLARGSIHHCSGLLAHAAGLLPWALQEPPMTWQRPPPQHPLPPWPTPAPAASSRRRAAPAVFAPPMPPMPPAAAAPVGDVPAAGRGPLSSKARPPTQSLQVTASVYSPEER